jgi:cyclase
MTVGGGIRSIEDARLILSTGGDKVTVNTAAVQRPELIKELAQEFGSQAVVLAIDARRSESGSWSVFTHGGREKSDLDAIEWAMEGNRLGAGEILLTSMDCDGTNEGFDCDLTRAVSRATNIPIIASGGGGTLDHFFEVFTRGEADAALAATVFHYGIISIAELKGSLSLRGIKVRV